MQTGIVSLSTLIQGVALYRAGALPDSGGMTPAQIAEQFGATGEQWERASTFLDRDPLESESFLERGSRIQQQLRAGTFLFGTPLKEIHNVGPLFFEERVEAAIGCLELTQSFCEEFHFKMVPQFRDGKITQDQVRRWWENRGSFIERTMKKILPWASGKKLFFLIFYPQPSKY